MIKIENIVWICLLVLTILFYIPTIINIFCPKYNVPLNIPYIFVTLFFILSIFLAKNSVQLLVILVFAIILYSPIAQLWNWCLLPFSKNKPFVEVYDSCKPLSERYHFGVKTELDRIMNIYKDPSCIHDNIPGFKIGKTSEACWRSINIKHSGKFSIDNMDKHFPVLYEILKAPDIITVLLSILDPGVGIPKHNGYSRGLMRYQLGYIIPKDRENAFIVVGGEKYNWKEGEGVMFDDIYYHYVENNTKEQRVVLYIDVLRDNLPEYISICNKWFVNMISYHPVISAINKKDHKHKQLE